MAIRLRPERITENAGEGFGGGLWCDVLTAESSPDEDKIDRGRRPGTTTSSK